MNRSNTKTSTSLKLIEWLLDQLQSEGEIDTITHQLEALVLPQQGKSRYDLYAHIAHCIFEQYLANPDDVSAKLYARLCHSLFLASINSTHNSAGFNQTIAVHDYLFSLCVRSQPLEHNIEQLETAGTRAYDGPDSIRNIGLGDDATAVINTEIITFLVSRLFGFGLISVAQVYQFMSQLITPPPTSSMDCAFPGICTLLETHGRFLNATPWEGEMRRLLEWAKAEIIIALGGSWDRELLAELDPEKTFPSPTSSSEEVSNENNYGRHTPAREPIVASPPRPAETFGSTEFELIATLNKLAATTPPIATDCNPPIQPPVEATQTPEKKAETNISATQNTASNLSTLPTNSTSSKGPLQRSAVSEAQSSINVLNTPTNQLRRQNTLDPSDPQALKQAPEGVAAGTEPTNSTNLGSIEETQTPKKKKKKKTKTGATPTQNTTSKPSVPLANSAWSKGPPQSSVSSRAQSSINIPNNPTNQPRRQSTLESNGLPALKQTPSGVAVAISPAQTPKKTETAMPPVATSVTATTLATVRKPVPQLEPAGGTKVVAPTPTQLPASAATTTSTTVPMVPAARATPPGTIPPSKQKKVNVHDLFQGGGMPSATTTTPIATNPPAYQHQHPMALPLPSPPPLPPLPPFPRPLRLPPSFPPLPPHPMQAPPQISRPTLPGPSTSGGQQPAGSPRMSANMPLQYQHQYPMVHPHHSPHPGYPMQPPPPWGPTGYYYPYPHYYNPYMHWGGHPQHQHQHTQQIQQPHAHPSLEPPAAQPRPSSAPPAPSNSPLHSSPVETLPTSPRRQSTSA